MALYALTRGPNVGVDLERIRPDFAGDDIAQRFFAPAEVAALRAVPADLRTKAFFNCWTRKEAFIKARGMGLSLPLDQFVVSLAPGESPALVSAQNDPQAAQRWCLYELEPGDGYVAAFAVEGKGCELQCWRWTS